MPKWGPPYYHEPPDLGVFWEVIFPIGFWVGGIIGVIFFWEVLLVIALAIVALVIINGM